MELVFVNILLHFLFFLEPPPPFPFPSNTKLISKMLVRVTGPTGRTYEISPFLALGLSQESPLLSLGSPILHVFHVPEMSIFLYPMSNAAWQGPLLLISLSSADLVLLCSISGAYLAGRNNFLLSLGDYSRSSLLQSNAFAFFLCITKSRSSVGLSVFVIRFP